MKIQGKINFKIAQMLLVPTLAISAGNNLAVVRSTSNALEVQLTNSEEIGGVQFSLHTSSDVVLGEMNRGNRTTESHWIVASYKPNDSTVNVAIVSLERKSFSAGSGSIATISFREAGNPESSRADFSDVMVADLNADSLGVTVSDLEWSNRASLASNAEPHSFVFGQNYPNPFNPSTKITYHLHAAAQVRLSVFDVAGREINRLVDSYQTTGDYSYDWNAAGGNRTLASGMYFAQLRVGSETVTKKMILAK